MQVINLSALAISFFVNQVMGVALPGGGARNLVARQSRPVAFNVAPAGQACGTGTTIFCSPSPGSPCTGNFEPAQASIVVTEAAGNCQVELFPEENQQGGVTESLDTDTTGTCVFTNVATWSSYEIICN
ncbi:hypothetical protein CPB84DRAFT_1966705 [Gymnopilus junonius]|uniref:Uncharacterized protein n=1 Tax=Gymnopilus junonius TaxID=109634 RepID=A0A9P5TH56_GYMJU|nr:hypothetical protein CPB84DRAFT_1966705 [Gymnopilus junonius]